jgi:hypothetical protein
MAGSSLSHLLPVLEGNSSYMVLTAAEVVDFIGGSPGPSVRAAEVVDFTGGSPGPSAKAAEANDMSNKVTARMRFIVSPIVGDSPETV